MKYEVHTINDTLEISLVGRLSYDDHADFHKMITAIDGVPGRRIVFALSRLDFIDSAGLGMFLVAKDMAAKRGMSVHLKGAHGLVRKLMDLVKFGGAVPMID